MATILADLRRRQASILAYRARRFPNMHIEGHLAELAPGMTPAERDEALAELIDALALRDGVAKVARLEPHEVADHLSAIDPKLIPSCAKVAYRDLLASARLRKAVAVRDLDRLTGHNQWVDTAIKRWQDVQDGEVSPLEVEPEFAHFEVLEEEAGKDLTAALGDLSFRAVHVLELAVERLRQAAEERLEGAYRALLGGVRVVKLRDEPHPLAADAAEFWDGLAARHGGAR